MLHIDKTTSVLLWYKSARRYDKQVSGSNMMRVLIIVHLKDKQNKHRYFFFFLHTDEDMPSQMSLYNVWKRRCFIDMVLLFNRRI